MTDRDDKKQLIARVERFLFQKIEYGSSSENELIELEKILRKLIDLKFDGGTTRIRGFVGDTESHSILAVESPLPGTVPEAEFVSHSLSVLRETNRFEQIIQMNLFAIMEQAASVDA